MTLLITGGGGFVMSCLARRWLEDDPAGHVVALDAAPADAALRVFFAPLGDRIKLVRGDVLDQGLLERLAAEHEITEIVHGAAVTSINRLAEVDPAKPELAGIRPALEVNIMGSVNLLAVATALPRMRRFIYVSSGAVYAAAGPPGAAMPEDGTIDADGYYDIGKYASELLTATTARRFGLAGQTVTVSALDAVGDFIHAFDVADAMIALLRAPAPRHPVYNIALGACASLREMVDMLREKLPGLRVEETGPRAADIDMDPAQREGRYGAYDISRLVEVFGWRPRPLREALYHYLDWVRQHGT